MFRKYIPSSVFFILFCFMLLGLSMIASAREEEGSITVIKVIESGSGSNTFDFTGDSVDDPGDPVFFSLGDGEQEVFTELPAGAYWITETVPGGWELVGVQCTGGSTESIEDGVLMHLDAGGDIICTFTNRRTSPIPSLTHWGMIVAAVLIGVFSTLAIRRKRRSA